MKLEKILMYNRLLSILAIVILFLSLFDQNWNELKKILSVIVPSLLYLNFFLNKKIVEHESGSPISFNIKRVAFEVLFLSVALINLLRYFWVL